MHRCVELDNHVQHYYLKKRPSVSSDKHVRDSPPAIVNYFLTPATPL
jgi:hypothetical protein